jgi:ATP-dependent exoDNAse (exonuclease V) alpha subunit
VAEHVQHAYALTAHTIQGGTVEWAGVVGRPDDFTRNWSYTALSRAREATELFLIDRPDGARARPRRAFWHPNRHPSAKKASQLGGRSELEGAETA